MYNSLLNKKHNINITEKDAEDYLVFIDNKIKIFKMNQSI